MKIEDLNGLWVQQPPLGSLSVAPNKIAGGSNFLLPVSPKIADLNATTHQELKLQKHHAIASICNMSLNQTPVFVSWGEDKKDVILVCSPSGSPLISSYVRDAFKEKHSPSVDTTDIHVYSKTDGELNELDYFDELGDNGKSRDCLLHITVEAQPVEPAPLPPATPRSKDVSIIIASVFEGEVNRYLDDHLQSVLPQCNFSKFKIEKLTKVPQRWKWILFPTCRMTLASLHVAIPVSVYML